MPDARPFFLHVSERLTTARFRETLLYPAVADMQHEWAEAGPSPRDRAKVLIRGVAGLLAATLLYGMFLPARHVREVWSGAEAPGLILLRSAFRTFVACTAVLLTVHFARAVVRSGWWFLPNTVGPGLFIWFPVALAIAVGRTIAHARDDDEKRRWTRAAPAVGLLGFAFCLGWAFTTVGPYRRLLRSEPARPPAISAVPDAARPGDRTGVLVRPPGRSARSEPRWHRWLTRPALCFSLVLLAAALAWSGYPQVLPAIVVAIFVACHTLMPQPWPPWRFHAAPLALAAVLALARRRRTVSTAR